MNEFIRLLRLGIRPCRAFELTYGYSPWSAILNFAFRMTVVGIIFALLYGALQWHDDSVEEAVQNHKGYTKSLEKVLARCLTSSGEPIAIGNEYYLCGVIPTGVKL